MGGFGSGRYPWSSRNTVEDCAIGALASIQANETCPRARKDQEPSFTGAASPEGRVVDALSGDTPDTR